MATQTETILPYPGLRPFKSTEADIFFGREEHVDQLLDKLGSRRFLAVVGSSGCGKSSVVRAGLVPALRSGFMGGAGPAWRVAQMRPGESPFKRLTAALLCESALQPERTDDPATAAFLEAALRRGPLGLVEAVEETHLPPGTNLLLVVDQFEEVFRYRRTRSIDDAEAFVNLLLTSAATGAKTLRRRASDAPRADERARIYVLLTMRSDFLGDCAFFPGLPEAMNESQFLTPRLNREQCRAAIVGPARLYGGELEPALVNQLLNDMAADPDQLPPLQHALMRMWTLAQTAQGGQANAGVNSNGSIRLTLAVYESIGRFKHALSHHADSVYDALSARQQKIAERMLRCLCERGQDQRSTRRPATVHEVAGAAGVEASEVYPVADAFRQHDRSFLNPPAETVLTPETVLDITHESLIGHWEKLGKWVTAEAAAAEMYGRLRAQAHLRAEGVGALFHELDLKSALKWERDVQPNAGWASRYGGDFDLTIGFLRESEAEDKRIIAEKEAAKAEREAAARKELQTAQQLASLAREKAQTQANAARRYRAAMFMVTGLLIAAAAAAVFAFTEGRKALSLKRNAQLQNEKTTEDAFQSSCLRASLLGNAYDFAGARTALKHAAALDPGPGRQFRPEHLHTRNLLTWYLDFMSPTPDEIYPIGDRELLNVAVSQDGKTLAATESGLVTLRDLENGGVIGILKTGAPALCSGLVFDPHGRWLATGAANHRVVLWALPITDPPVRFKEFDAGDDVRTIAVDPAGARVACVCAKGAVLAWEVDKPDGRIALKPPLSPLDPTTQAASRRITNAPEPGFGLAFAPPNGDFLASAAPGKAACIWDMRTGDVSRLLESGGSARSVAFCPVGGRVASVTDDGRILISPCSPTGPRQSGGLSLVRGPASAAAGLKFFRGSSRLASPGWNGNLSVWDTDTGIRMKLLQGHTAGTIGVTARDGDAFVDLFSSGGDGMVCRWRFHSQDHDTSMRMYDLQCKLSAAAIAPDGSTLAVGFDDGMIRLYGLPNPDPSNALWTGQADQRINRLDFSPDGQWLASGSGNERVPPNAPATNQAREGKVIVWKVNVKEAEKHILDVTSRGGIQSVAFAPRGLKLAVGTENGSAGIFELEGGFDQARRQFFKADESSVLSATFDPSGTRLVTAGEKNGTRVWDLKPAPAKPVEDRGFPRTAGQHWATFSPDGLSIATAGRDQMVRLMNSHDGFIANLRGHAGQVERVEFGGNNTQIFSVGGDSTLRAWDLPAQQLLFTLSLTPISLSSNMPAAMSDFAVRCTKSKDCWIAVPMVNNYLVLYHLPNVYE